MDKLQVQYSSVSFLPQQCHFTTSSLSILPNFPEGSIQTLEWPCISCERRLCPFQKGMCEGQLHVKEDFIFGNRKEDVIWYWLTNGKVLSGHINFWLSSRQLPSYFGSSPHWFSLYKRSLSNFNYEIQREVRMVFSKHTSSCHSSKYSPIFPRTKVVMCPITHRPHFLLSSLSYSYSQMGLLPRNARHVPTLGLFQWLILLLRMLCPLISAWLSFSLKLCSVRLIWIILFKHVAYQWQPL